MSSNLRSDSARTNLASFKWFSSSSMSSSLEDMAISNIFFAFICSSALMEALNRAETSVASLFSLFSASLSRRKTLLIPEPTSPSPFVKTFSFSSSFIDILNKSSIAQS